MKKALYIMDKEMQNHVYNQDTQADIQANFDIIGETLTRENCLDHKDLLAKVENIFSSWGGPIFSEEFLEAAPHLEGVFYAAGSMKKLIQPTFWKRDITVSNANEVNALPVAEYTLSQIIFSLKNGWQMTRRLKNTREFHFEMDEILGGYNRTVGLISLSSIGRKTVELLKPFDVNIVAYDPFVSAKEAEELDVEMVSLEELFKRSYIVSLHSPLLPETTGLITGQLLQSMKKNATFINTARGAIVKQDELIDVLRERKDLTAILDVTFPEPPSPDSALYDLDNIVITPHIAGSAGSEVARMGRTMFNEAIKYVNNESLDYQITEEQFQTMA